MYNAVVRVPFKEYHHACIYGRTSLPDRSQLCHIYRWQGLTEKEKKKIEIQYLVIATDDLGFALPIASRKTLFWVRTSDHHFCFKGIRFMWWLPISLETVGQFCQNKIDLRTLSELIAILYLMYLCKCVPGRTKIGAVPWRCRHEVLCDPHNSGNQISYRTVFPGWTVPRFSVSVFKTECITSDLLIFFEVLREMPVQEHSPRKPFSFSLYNFIYTKYLIAKWRQLHINASLSH